VKYKRLAATEIKHADLYQLHSYATAAALSGGLLIYAAGEAEDIIHEVVNVGKRLQIMTLDLQGQPAEILADIRTVADRIREMREQALTLA
jgi:5-methylcytosine-specific restriction enzyme subunit McrC